MMEHVYFDFTVFGIEKTVASLSEFLQFVHETLKHFPLEIARNIAEGLFFSSFERYRPSRSETKQQHISDEPALPWATTRKQTVLSILRKSYKMQVGGFRREQSNVFTNSNICENTYCSIDRGKPAFMAPEAHLEATRPMNQEDLKQADTWSFAMIVCCLMNPDVDHPYEHCLSPDGKKESIESLKVFSRSKTFTSTRTRV